MENTKNQLDQRNDLDCSSFKKKYLEKKKPVIISNSFNCEALQKWNLDYLKSVYPTKIVSLTVLNPALNILGSNVNLHFPEALNLIQHNHDENKKHYLMQRSLHEEFPALVPDITIPHYLENNCAHINLWLGEKGINTKAHYDYYDNFLTQIFGRKRVRLFAPADTPYMHGYSVKDTMIVEGVEYPSVHSSQIADIDFVDIDKFPNIKFAIPFEGILNPGDLLYIPAGWWHEVKSLDVTMSINFWWKIKIENFPSLQLTYIVCSYFDWFGNSFFERMCSAFELSEFKDNLQIAEFCLSKDLKCVAAFFLLDHINKIINDQNINNVVLFKEYLSISKKCNDNLLNKEKMITIISKLKTF